MTTVDLLNGRGKLSIKRVGDVVEMEATFDDIVVRRAQLAAVNLETISSCNAVYTADVSIHRLRRKFGSCSDPVAMYFNPNAYLAIVPASALAQGAGVKL